jgi:hypothetical protein
MCSTCCTLGEVGEYRENQFLVETGVVSRPCGRLGRGERGEDNIKVILRENELAVDSSGLRLHLTLL